MCRGAVLVVRLCGALWAGMCWYCESAGANYCAGIANETGGVASVLQDEKQSVIDDHPQQIFHSVFVVIPAIATTMPVD